MVKNREWKPEEDKTWWIQKKLLSTKLGTEAPGNKGFLLVFKMLIIEMAYWRHVFHMLDKILSDLWYYSHHEISIIAFPVLHVSELGHREMK